MGVGCRRLYTREGWVKREAKVMCGVDEDTDDDVSAARGTSGDARAMRGTVIGAARGTGGAPGPCMSWASSPHVARVWTSGPRVAWAGTSAPCVAQVGAPGLRVALRQSLRYLQQKNGRVEQWGELQNWTRRGSPSHQEVGRRRQRGRMTHKKQRVRRSTGGSW
jgi:hypothetical protein